MKRSVGKSSRLDAPYIKLKSPAEIFYSIHACMHDEGSSYTAAGLGRKKRNLASVLEFSEYYSFRQHVQGLSQETLEFIRL